MSADDAGAATRKRLVADGGAREAVSADQHMGG
jgi:hypothetical protein